LFAITAIIRDKFTKSFTIKKSLSHNKKSESKEVSAGYDFIGNQVLPEIEIKYITQLRNIDLRWVSFPPQWKVMQIIMMSEAWKICRTC